MNTKEVEHESTSVMAHARAYCDAIGIIVNAFHDESRNLLPLFELHNIYTTPRWRAKNRNEPNWHKIPET